jgi:antitoxin component YwqK of YwqJK toxin-antitoxin module
MKLPHVLLILGVSGLAVSVYALQGRLSAAAGNNQSTYYANGQVQSQTEYVDGQREGTTRRFYADGARMAEGQYAAGKMEGRWTFWLPGGEIDRERTGDYHDGKKRAESAGAQQAGF